MKLAIHLSLKGYTFVSQIAPDDEDDMEVHELATESEDADQPVIHMGFAPPQATL